MLLDFGLVVLIWMVQLIVYPGFKYYSKAELIKWHNTYSWRITLIVLPLMGGQLLLALYQVFTKPTLASIIYLSVVVLVWLLTFLYFVPAHKKISSGQHTPATLQALVSWNWWRTLLWSLLFIWSWLFYDSLA